jgi:hypothetical protein
MKKKPTKLKMHASLLSGVRMQAIQVAANLRDPEPSMPGGMMGGVGFPGKPGKTAEQVVRDAEKIVAFVLAP